MSNKFETIQPWLNEILTAIKKDVKNDYLTGSPKFYFTHFGKRPIGRLTTEEINPVLIKELLAGNEDLAEWVVNRFVFKHGDIYDFFATKLEQINPDIGAIEVLTNEQSEQILLGANYPVKDIFLFAVMNGVVFPQAIFDRLRKETVAFDEKKQADETKLAEEQELAKMIERHQKEVFRLTEKYEQKLAGVLKKYMADTEALKKQVRALQKKL